MNEPEQVSRRDLLKGGALLAVAVAAAPAVAAEPQPAPPLTHDVICGHGCGSVLGKSDRHEMTGLLCDDCARALQKATEERYRADRALVEAKNLTLEQATTIRFSTRWGQLSDGKRDAVQAVIDSAADPLANGNGKDQ